MVREKSLRSNAAPSLCFRMWGAGTGSPIAHGGFVPPFHWGPTHSTLTAGTTAGAATSGVLSGVGVSLGHEEPTHTSPPLKALPHFLGVPRSDCISGWTGPRRQPGNAGAAQPQFGRSPTTNSLCAQSPSACRMPNSFCWSKPNLSGCSADFDFVPSLLSANLTSVISF